MDNVNVNKFDIERIISRRGCTIVVNGKSHQERSVFIKHLLYEFHKKTKLPRAVVFSKSERGYATYEKFGIPKRYIFTSFNDTALSQIYSYQEMMKEKQRNGEISSDLDLRIAVIIDDCDTDKKVFNSSLMNEVLVTGPCCDMIVVASVSYPLAIAPQSRNQINFFVSAACDQASARKQLWTHFTSVYEDYSIFNQVMQTVTSDKKFMVIDNVTESTEEVHEKLFCFKPIAGKRCRFGSREYRDYAKIGDGRCHVMATSNLSSGIGTKKTNVRPTIKVKTA